MNHFLRAIASEAWAIHPGKAQEILGYLEARAAGTPPEPSAAINGNQARSVRNADGSVAVVPVRGAIANRASMMDGASLGVGTSAERIRTEVEAAVNDQSVKAVILDVDSPGGAAAGTPETAAYIRSLRGGRVPIVAQVDGMGASAAYWIASAADEVVATPSSQVGSIGVISIHESVARLMEDAGIDETVITSENAPRKRLGNPYETLTEDGREKIQARVDEYERMFIDAVAENRGVDRETVIGSYGQGDTLLANPARRAGMIDRVATMRETLERFGAGNKRRRDDTRAAARSTTAATARHRVELERLRAR